MDEYIRAKRVGRDEAKAFCVVEPLNMPCRHDETFYVQIRGELKNINIILLQLRVESRSFVKFLSKVVAFLFGQIVVLDKVMRI